MIFSIKLDRIYIMFSLLKFIAYCVLNIGHVWPCLTCFYVMFVMFEMFIVCSDICNMLIVQGPVFIFEKYLLHLDHFQQTNISAN